MFNYKNRIILATFLIFLTATSALVLANGAGKFNVSRPMFVLGTELKAGLYDISWEANGSEAVVVFMIKKKAVATVKGKIEERAKESDFNSLGIGKDSEGRETIKSLQFRGGKTAVVFE